MIVLSRTYVAWIWPLSILLMQVTLYSYDGFPVNIGFLSVLFLVVLCLPRVSVSIGFLVSCLGLLAVIFVSVFFVHDYVGFLKSYVQIALLILAVLVAYGTASLFSYHVEHAATVMVNAGIAVAFLIIMQAFTWNLGLGFWLAAPFGDWTPLGPGGEIYIPNEAMTMKRPNGVFSEPSIAGWMMSYLVAMVWSVKNFPSGARRNIPSIYSLIFSAAAILSGSVTGILGVLMVWTAIVVSRSKGIYATGRLFVLAVVILLAIGAIAFYKPSNDYFVQRFAHATEPGTSIYYRVVAPSLLLKDSLQDHPFGHPVGDVSYIRTKDYMVNWEGGSNTNIDNSFILIAYHFGWPGLVVVCVVLLAVLRLLVKRSVAAPLIVAQVVALMATGALWAPWIALMLCFTIAVVVNLTYDKRSAHA